MHETFLNLQPKITQIRHSELRNYFFCVLHDLSFHMFEGADSKYKDFFKDFLLKVLRKEQFFVPNLKLSLRGTLHFD